MAARDHVAAIAELVDHMERIGLLARDGREETLKALHSREEFVSTGIGSGVAIPHAFSESIDDVIAVMGRSRAGIDFLAHDNALVHLVILFIVPRQHYHLHLRTLAAIARLFHDDEMKRNLLAADSSADMVLTLRRGAPRAAIA